MTNEPEWRRRNRANWDERVPIHLNAPAVYDLQPLHDGTGRLGAITAAVLGPVDGLKILHLQCHFGRDSLILAQQGARVTGIDFSSPAIDAARALAGECGIDARFLVSDVYETAAVLPEPASFDRVFVSWGALIWLPDMAGWARVVAHFLKPGGYLALAEAHPAPYVFDSATKTPDGMPGWFHPYLARTPLIEDRTEDYADPDARLTNTRTHEWVHPLSDIMMGLIDAGLRIDRFEEHDSVAWQMFDCLVRSDTGGWRWPDKPWLPLSYSLRASKSA
jgi:SAM-dependent methyltransferase